MATIIRDKIKQPDGKTFKLVDATDVEHKYKDDNGSDISTDVETYLNDLTTRVKANESSIEALGDTYYTEGEVDAALADKADQTYVDGQLETKVPTTRKVNDKELSSDIVLTAEDVHALPDTTTIPSVDGLATTEYVDGKFGDIDQKISAAVESHESSTDTLHVTKTEKDDWTEGIRGNADKIGAVETYFTIDYATTFAFTDAYIEGLLSAESG